MFEWIRRGEIAGGVFAIIVGLYLWNAGWWHWIPIALGIYGLLPFGGATSLLRKAERDPSAFVSDPGQRRERARRFAFLMPAVFTAAGVLFGWMVGGWGAAVFIGALMGLSGALGAWWSVRRERVP